MPKFLENKLKTEYPNNPDAVFGTLNNIGAMKGNQETPKGVSMQAKHTADMKKKKKKPAGMAIGILMGPSKKVKTRSDIDPSRQ